MTRDLRADLADDLRSSATTICPLIAVLLLIAWLPASAAYSPAIYCAGGVGILILIVTTVAQGISAPSDAARSRGVAITAAVAFAVWNYISIAWAQDAGTAFDGANRTALYAAVFVLFALSSWTPRLVYLAVGTYAAGAVTIASFEFVRTVHSAHPENNFISGRLALPSGYENASAALMIVAVLGSIIVAARRDLPPLLRALMFAISTAGIDLAILVQSRGSVLGVSIAVPTLLLLSRDRHRILAVLILITAAVLVAAQALGDVYAATDQGFDAFRGALNHSLHMGELSVAAAFLLGLLWSLTDRVLPIAPRAKSAADRAVLALVLLAVVAPLLLAAVRPSLANRSARSAWRSFVHGGSPTGTNRFSSLGSGRYDFYRVAWSEVAHHPVAGVGSDNFAIDYLRARRTDQEPLYPHSDILRIPAQTGLVGSLLALVFVGGLVACARRSWATAPMATTTLLVPLVYWLAQGSFDWLWEVAGVTSPLAAWAGAATSVRGTSSAPRRLSLLARLAIISGALALGIPLVAGWLSGREVNAALSHWRVDPASAIGELHQAASLDPFSDRPNLFAAAIAARVGAPRTMKEELRRAETRNPDNWYTHLLLAVLASQRHDWTTATAQTTAAYSLNPREPTIADVRNSVRRRHVVQTSKIDDIFLERAAQRVRSGVTP